MIERIQISKLTIPAAKHPSPQSLEPLFKKVWEQDQKTKTETESSKSKPAPPPQKIDDELKKRYEEIRKALEELIKQPSDVSDEMSIIETPGGLFIERTYEGKPVIKIRPPIMSDETFDKLAVDGVFITENSLVQKFIRATGEIDLTPRGVAAIKAKYLLDLEPYMTEAGSNNVRILAAALIDRHDRSVKDSDGETLFTDGVITKKDLMVAREFN